MKLWGHVVWSAGMPRVLTDPILTKLSRHQLNVNAKDSLWDVLSCWSGSSDQLSTALWILQKWDKTPNHLCWHTAHLCAWQKFPSWSHVLPWATPGAAKLGWEKQFHGCSLKLTQFYSLCFCYCLGLAHEWDFTGQFKYEMWNMGKWYPLWCQG